jgi:hypothetical protein
VNSLLALTLLLPSKTELRPLAPTAPKISIDPTMNWEGESSPEGHFPGYGVSRTVRVQFPNRPGSVVRARVCGDSTSRAGDLEWASRTLARVWELNYVRLGLDLPATVENQTLHLLLRSDGEAGGEQVLTRPTGDQSLYPWCVVYLYQVPTLTEPAERWREIAHEYGHAVLPAWGPYTGPEAYSNGDVGERLATAWMYEELNRGSAEPSDAAGSTAKDLLGYMQTKVWGEAAQFALAGPDYLDAKGPTGYWAGVRMVTYCQQTLPPSVFRRALGLGGGTSATNLNEGISEALSEQSSVTLNVLPALRGKPAWFPAGSLRPATRVLARRDGWVKTVATGATLTLTRAR